MVQELNEKLKHEEHHIEVEIHLAILIKRSENVLRQIKLSSEHGALLFTPVGSLDSGRLTSSGWIRNHNLLEQLSKEMRNIRVEITGALTLVNAYVSNYSVSRFLNKSL